jgi:hypothetical protein
VWINKNIACPGEEERMYTGMAERAINLGVIVQGEGKKHIVNRAKTTEEIENTEFVLNGRMPPPQSSLGFMV